uniref:Uncharacterized protein n=1 Tax=Peronospora matthiolae TaxID=2874970 RepID=A0AAV1U0Z8_9STRA
MFGSSGSETKLPPQKEGDHLAARNLVSSASEYLLPQESVIPAQPRQDFSLPEKWRLGRSFQYTPGCS